MASLAALSDILNPATVLNAVAPTRDLAIRADVVYGDGPQRKLDIYAPRSAQDAPIVVFFYGGSWQRGSKAAYRFLAADLAQRGFIAVVPDYTVYPDGKFPSFIEDGARALGWIKENRAGLGSASDKLIVMGHSAGAHIAAMLAFDARWLAPWGLDPRRDIAGFVGLAGPYDFLPIKGAIIRAIFEVADLAATQPITFVAGGEAPTFLGVAPSDTIVRPGNSERLAARLRDVGSAVTLKRYPRTGHLSIIGTFSPLLRLLGPVADDVTRFIRTLPR